MDLSQEERLWETRLINYLKQRSDDPNDASHDLGHFQRVYKTAHAISQHESLEADLLVLVAAAYLHDIVSLPKNHPDNKFSSRYAAIKARGILTTMNFPKEKLDAVCHAIEAHSFSAKIQPETIEAKIIQDADRMEALGALGAMRTFYVSGRLGRSPYHTQDFYAKERQLDDKSFALDHFYVKLFQLPALLQTHGGRLIAEKRTQFLELFVKQLEEDIECGKGGAMALVWACYHAGEHRLQLFDQTDPFAIRRRANPDSFALDHLIELHQKGDFTPFTDQFFRELQDEIG
jgi:uncharacterized protein